MKHYLFTSMVIALFFLFRPVFSQSQTTGYSINPKMGIFMRANQENGAAAGAEINYLHKGWILSADFYQFHEIRLLSTGDIIFRQMGIMAGKYYGDRLFRVQLQGGVAPIWQVGYNYGSESDPFSTVGLVLKTGFKFIPLRFLSIGLDVQSNFNSQKSLVMPLISIEIGNLRPGIN